VWSIEQGIASSITDNTIVDSWGVGIYDAYQGSFMIGPGNSSLDTKGLGTFILGKNSLIDARQARPLSLGDSNVQPGEDAEVALNVAHIAWTPLKTFVVTLKVNEQAIDVQQVTLEIGQSALLILKGKAEIAGTLSVLVE